jgi:hypothetical protein
MRTWLREGTFCHHQRRQRRGQDHQSLHPESLNQWYIESLPFSLRDHLCLISWPLEPLRDQRQSLESHSTIEQFRLARLIWRDKISLARKRGVQLQGRLQRMQSRANPVPRLSWELNPSLAHLKLGRQPQRKHKSWHHAQPIEQSRLLRRRPLSKPLLLCKPR